MKNYLRILETCKRDRLHKTVNLRSGNQELDQWQALSLTEEMAGELLARLKGVVGSQLQVKIVNVKSNFFEKSTKDSIVRGRAQLYENEHRRILLKVFVHQENGKGKTVRIARSIYELELVQNMLRTKVA